ncbi:trypsin domain-containing protein [Phthorimaea operculella]|nr:trypsin domain-containing protein [Phthorimaea operculella]
MTPSFPSRVALRPSDSFGFTSVHHSTIHQFTVRHQQCFQHKTTKDSSPNEESAPLAPINKTIQKYMAIGSRDASDDSNLLTSQIRIRVGEYDFSSVSEQFPFVERGVARKAVHPKYNFFTYEYDLALVKLESPVAFAPHISPICLPATDDLLVGENATVTGWGRLSEGGVLPSILQEVQVPIVSNERCKSMFLRAGRHEFIPDIFLCAGHERGGHDSCQGDSGGPLQVKGKDSRYFLAGIISWGIGCGEANLPGVCTRISKFVPWILQTVNS